MSVHRYDSREQPPAPYVTIHVTDPQSGDARIVDAKSDTGASRTVLPVSILSQLGLFAEDTRFVSGFDRNPVSIPVFRVTLEVEGVVMDEIRVLAVNRADALLGRDILNQFDITLRGKAQVFEMAAA